MNDPSGSAGAAILLSCTFAILAFTLFWAVANNRRPAVARTPLTGRRASPYWYSPTGLQDERGITAQKAAARAAAKAVVAAGTGAATSVRSRILG